MKQKIIVVDRFLEEPYKFKTSTLNTQEIQTKISHILQSNIQLTPVDFPNTSNIVANYSADYIAVLYLDYPTECINKNGVSFWLHKETQDEELPNQTKLEWLGLNTIEEVIASYDTTDKTKWEQYMNYFMKYNRLILFDAKLFHSYGDDCDNRKFLVSIK